MSITTNTSKKSLFDGRKVWFIFAAGSAVVAAIIVFAIMSLATAKESYYVLTQDIPARTAITMNLLEEITTSNGSAPPTALTQGEINNSELFSLYSLKQGDIITQSNSGDLLTLSEGLPSDFVIASFTADPSMAAGGNVQRGDYIDIVALVDDPEVTGVTGMASSYILQRVLVIDATVNLDTYSSESETTGEVVTSGDGVVSSNTADTGMRAGIPTMFTVGLSPENAAILGLATQYDLYVVISSAESTNDGVVPQGLTPQTTNGVWGDPRNAGEGTDNLFGQGGTDVKKPSTETGKETSKPSTPEPEVPETEEPAPEETDTGDTGNTDEQGVG